MQSTTSKLLLRPTEAAELISLSRSKVYALLRDGTIPSVRVGKSLRVPRRELEMWAERLVSESTHEA